MVPWKILFYDAIGPSFVGPPTVHLSSWLCSLLVQCKLIWLTTIAGHSLWIVFALSPLFPELQNQRLVLELCVPDLLFTGTTNLLSVYCFSALILSLSAHPKWSRQPAAQPEFSYDWSFLLPTVCQVLAGWWCFGFLFIILHINLLTLICKLSSDYTFMICQSTDNKESEMTVKDGNIYTPSLCHVNTSLEFLDISL